MQDGPPVPPSVPGFLAFLLDSFRQCLPDPELPYLCLAFLTLGLLGPCRCLAQFHLLPPFDLFLLHPLEFNRAFS